MYGRDVYANSVWGSTVQCKRGSKLKLLTLPTLPAHPGVTFVNAGGGSQLPYRVQVAADGLRSSPPRPLIFVWATQPSAGAARAASLRRAPEPCAAAASASQSPPCAPPGGARATLAAERPLARTLSQPVLVLLSRDRVVKAHWRRAHWRAHWRAYWMPLFFKRLHAQTITRSTSPPALRRAAAAGPA